MATLIGLCLRVKLLRSLPERYKVDIEVTPGTHSSELAGTFSPPPSLPADWSSEQTAERQRTRCRRSRELSSAQYVSLVTCHSLTVITDILEVVNQCIAHTD